MAITGPKSRGIPTKKALLFEYGKLPMSLSARWEAEDILKMLFPPHMQSVQYGIAVRLLAALRESGQMNGRQLAEWAEENKAANSTLRNLVIPKLVRFGLLARERENPTGQSDKDKRHHMVLKPSLRFGEALQHIGKEWSSLVHTWRVKRNEPASP
ncbi:MAG: hypothetical protein Q8P02_00550 [Candidatus Micrarchaeota archaeon]|nr:hypothetical protein [Candidatus Micrarchaeota archaeon]